MKVQRAFVELDGRRNHLRYAGTGAPVVVLHQSPQSSRAVLPLIELLSERFLVIAPDTPGFGQSDPRPGEQPSIAGFADNLHALLLALGLDKVMVVGTHTGAEIALELTLRHSGMVTHLVTDGLPLFIDAERQDILAHYFEPLPLCWDGSHLVRLWARLRQQSIFFPWFAKTPDARLDYDLPDVDYLQSWLLDYLYAGPNFSRGYGAAFRWDGLAAVAGLNSPAHLLYRRREPLATHQERLPPLAAGVVTETTPHDPAAMRERILEVLTDNDPGSATGSLQLPPSQEGFVDTVQCLLRLRKFGAANQSSVLLLHDAGSSGAELVPLAQVLASNHHVLLPDLPGHGESTACPGEVSVLAMAAALEQLLDTQQPFALVAVGASVALADALIQRIGDRCSQLILHNPMLPATPDRAVLAQRYRPALEPDSVGSHLLKAWQILRDGRLFWPWFEPVRGNIVHCEPKSDEELHRQLFDMLRCGSRHADYWQQLLQAPIDQALELAGQRVTATADCPHVSGVATPVIPVANLAAAGQQHARWLAS